VSWRARQPLAARWSGIRLAVFDVDGVLTDGRLAIASAALAAGPVAGPVAGPSTGPSAGLSAGRTAAGRTAADLTVETKVFHVLDGHGLKQIARAGIAVAWISGRDSPAVVTRARELGVTRLHQGISDKMPVLEAIVGELGIDFDAVLCMGDDMADLPLLRRCAIAVTVAHAPPTVKLAADLVARQPGGCGAVRELCDRLLHAIGRHDLLDETEIRAGDDAR